jgi:hypothetical protein
LWTAEVLDSTRQSAELKRARELRPIYDRVDYLLDLHSMTDRCPPLAMAGLQHKGVELAQALGSPEHVIVDGGHAAGRRLRDYAFFDAADDPRNALLIECGQHWEAGGARSRQAGLAQVPASLRDGRCRRFLDAHLEPMPAPPQKVIEVTSVVTIVSDAFAFTMPASGLAVVAKGGTLLARDGARRNLHALRQLRADHADAPAERRARPPCGLGRFVH